MNTCVQEPVNTTNAQIRELVAKARVAQAAFESFSQEQVDAIVKGIGKYVYDNAEMLARMAVDETGIGVYEDKILKNKGKARVIWNNLKDKKSRGIIGEDAETNMVFVAKPMGVVGAVTPVTNPIVTPMCNAMFALKTGNAVIFAPHPKAEKCTELLTDEFMKVVKANGGPDDLVQMVKNGSIETTQELMKVGRRRRRHRRRRDGQVGLLVGQAVVRRRRRQRAGDHRPRRRPQGRGRQDRHWAPRSTTASSARTSSSCSRPRSSTPRRVERVQGTGKVWFTEDEAQIQKLRDVVFPGGHLNKDVVGRSAARDRRDGGHRRAGDARASSCCRPRAPATDDVLAKEKLCPVVAILPVQDVQGSGRSRPRPTCSSKARATRRRCTRTTKRTSATPASSCRSAGSSSTRRAR